MHAPRYLTYYFAKTRKVNLAKFSEKNFLWNFLNISLCATLREEGEDDVRMLKQFKDISEWRCFAQFSWLVITYFIKRLISLVPLIFTGVEALLCISYHPLKVSFCCAPTILIISRLIVILTRWKVKDKRNECKNVLNYIQMDNIEKISF